ncbi:hypothetical protein DXG01_011260 [Tephrocybe rancida]|nr:hypothetical protein DXG01_011260 [Tephrocybe rancida]
MDVTFLHALQQMEEEEDEAEGDLLERAMIAAALIAFLEEEAHRICADQRHPSRLYLRRGQLLPNPRVGTPWQVLYDSRDNRAFIMTMGFDVAMFDYIMESGFEYAWFWTAIPHPDTPTVGAPHPGGRSLDATGALGLVLHYLNSTMRKISLQQIFMIIPSTVSHYITFGLQILLAVL